MVFLTNLFHLNSFKCTFFNRVTSTMTVWGRIKSGLQIRHFEKKLKRKKLKTQRKNSIRQHPFSNYVERGRGAI